MTSGRDHPVESARERQQVVSEYRRDGYSEIDRADDTVTLRTVSHGGLLAHLALFFTLGWLTLGVANVLYAVKKRRETHDVVRVVEQ
jgi:hypothetical protein